MRHARTLATLVLCGILSSPSLFAASAKTLHVTVENVAFGDLPADAQVGDVVEWANKDFVAHTATARDGSFDVNLMPGKSGRIVLKHPGKIAFYCRYHPTMTGEITVAR